MEKLIKVDQAAGLRAFAQAVLPQSRRLCVSVFVGTPSTVGVANQLGQKNKRTQVIQHTASQALLGVAQMMGAPVVLVDQTAGTLARAAGVSVRYDLLHLLEGDRGYDRVSVVCSPRVRLLPAQRGLAALLQLPNGVADWLMAFRRLPTPPAHVMIYLGANEQGSLISLLRQLDALQHKSPETLDYRLTVLLGDTQMAALEAYQSIKQWCKQGLSLAQAPALWCFAGADVVQAQQHACNLQDSLQQFLGLPLESATIIPYHVETKFTGVVGADGANGLDAFRRQESWAQSLHRRLAQWRAAWQHKTQATNLNVSAEQESATDFRYWAATPALAQPRAMGR